MVSLTYADLRERSRQRLLFTCQNSQVNVHVNVKFAFISHCHTRIHALHVYTTYTYARLTHIHVIPAHMPHTYPCHTLRYGLDSRSSVQLTASSKVSELSLLK